MAQESRALQFTSKKERNGRHFGMWITTHLNQQTYTYNLVIW